MAESRIVEAVGSTTLARGSRANYVQDALERALADHNKELQPQQEAWWAKRVDEDKAQRKKLGGAEDANLPAEKNAEWEKAMAKWDEANPQPMSDDNLRKRRAEYMQQAKDAHREEVNEASAEASKGSVAEQQAALEQDEKQ